MERKDKKGQIGGLQVIITTVVIVGLLIGVAFMIFGSLRTTMTTTTTTVHNETVVPTTTGVYLSKNISTAGINCWNSASIVRVTNSTDPTILTAANYTLDPNSGKFSNLSSSDLYLAAWNVTYTYKSGDEACQGVVDTMNATKQIPTFLPIVVILGIIGIILAIVFGLLPKVGNKDNAYV